MWQGKNARKEHLEGESYQEGLQQENCLGSQIKNMTKNIGADWKETGDNGRVNNQGKGK